LAVGPKVKRLIPWILSLAVVAFLLATTDLAMVGEALATADWPRLLGLMALVTALAFFADSLTLVYLFRRFVAPVSHGEVLAIKGVSYFFNAINYSLAAGAMAWLLHKRRSVPFLETFSSLVWFFFVDVIALVAMMTFGYAVAHEHFAATPFAEPLPILVAILWAVVLGSLIYWNGRFDFLVLGVFRRWRVFATFARARLADYPAMVAARVAFIMVYVLMHWLLLPAFGVHIDLWLLLVYSPLIAFVQVFPATISGLGAVQGVMVALFAGHVPPEAGDGQAVILAYSAIVGPLMAVMRLAIGYAFVARITRDIVPTRAEVDAAREAAERDSATPPPTA